MSIQTLYTAATGMESLQTKLDVIANNLANVNTTGFKKGRANFEDNFYRNYKYPGTQDSQGNLTATGTSVGLGSHVQSVQTSQQQGAFQVTNGQYDMAIEGQGYFQVQDSSGQTLYTRAGNFSINANGELVLGSASMGRKLFPNVTLPLGATNFGISADGQMSWVENGNQAQGPALQIATFPNPEGLLKLGDNLYSVSNASGPANNVTPAQNGVGQIRQGALEASNVEPVQELIDLITTQRSFELNSQAIQAGDQILQLISNLRR